MTIVNTKVNTASIFRSGAEVVRTGEVSLKEGTSVLEITGISASADRNTVRFFTSQPFLCTRFRFLSDKEREYRKKESDNIREEIELLNRENEARALQISLWQTNGNFTAHTGVNPAEVEAYIEALPKRILALNKETAEANKKIKDLQEKLNEAVKRESGPILYAEIQSEAEGVCALEIRYQEPQAGWNPFYEIHTDAEHPLELRMRADIRETTGEDWEDVKLSLLSGNPSLGDKLPELRPLYVDLRAPVPASPRGFSNAMGAGMRMAVMEDAAAPMAMEDTVSMAVVRAETPMAEVSEEQTMSEYLLPQRQRIPSDPNGVYADLLTFEIPADYEIVTAPRKHPHAYFTAKISTKDLPPREINYAQVYLRGIYTGDTDLNPDFSEDSVTLSLGREEHIHVTSKQVQKKSGSVLLKGQKYTEYGYETSVTNNTSKEASVVILDQIPVSQNKSVTVDIITIDGADLNEETGILKKTVKVSPKQTVTVRLAYKISWPKDKNIQEIYTPSAVQHKFCPECGSITNSNICPTCGYRIR